MGDKIGVYPAQLSGGQQQRIAIARAMVHNPPIIVCDEPTSFLDIHTGLKIMELLKEMVKSKGTTLIVVTHDPRILEFADKIDHLEEKWEGNKGSFSFSAKGYDVSKSGHHRGRVKSTRRRDRHYLGILWFWILGVGAQTDRQFLVLGAGSLVSVPLVARETSFYDERERDAEVRSPSHRLLCG